MSIAQNKETVRRSLEAFNEQDMDAFQSFMAPSLSYANPARPDIRDLPSWMAYLDQLTASYPDRCISVEALIAEGDQVVLRYTFRGTHLGRSPSLDIPATGKQVEMLGVSIYRLTAGRIVDVAETWDLYSLMRQLGAQSLPRAA